MQPHEAHRFFRKQGAVTDDSISERKKHPEQFSYFNSEKNVGEAGDTQTCVLKWMNTLMLALAGDLETPIKLHAFPFFLFSSHFLLPLISFFPFFLPYFFPSSPSLPALLSSFLPSSPFLLFLFLPVDFVNLNIHSGRNQQLDVTICITTVFILMLWIW